MPAQVPQIGAPVAHERRQRLVQAEVVDQAAERRALAAGDDQPVEPAQVVRRPHLACRRAEAAQHGFVLDEIAL